MRVTGFAVASGVNAETNRPFFGAFLPNVLSLPSCTGSNQFGTPKFELLLIHHNFACTDPPSLPGMRQSTASKTAMRIRAAHLASDQENARTSFAVEGGVQGCVCQVS